MCPTTPTGRSSSWLLSWIMCVVLFCCAGAEGPAVLWPWVQPTDFSPFTALRVSSPSIARAYSPLEDDYYFAVTLQQPFQSIFVNRTHKAAEACLDSLSFPEQQLPMTLATPSSDVIRYVTLPDCLPSNISHVRNAVLCGRSRSEAKLSDFGGVLALASSSTCNRSYGRVGPASMLRVVSAEGVTEIERSVFQQQLSRASGILWWLPTSQRSERPQDITTAVNVHMCRQPLSTVVNKDASILIQTLAVTFSTSEKCLTLPNEIMEGVLSWSDDVYCSLTKTGQRLSGDEVVRYRNQTQVFCTSSTSVPPLEFYFPSTTTHSDAQAYLEVPLVNGTDNTGNYSWCMQLGGSLFHKEELDIVSVPPSLILASWQLKLLPLIVDPVDGQLGLVLNQTTIAPFVKGWYLGLDSKVAAVPSGSCASQTKCDKGSEQLVGRTNKCLNPACTALFFTVYDDVTSECTLQPMIVVAVVFAFTILALLEILLILSQRTKVTRQLQHMKTLQD